jgi:hypothetical protein
MVRGAGLVHIGVEEVGRGGVVVRLSHHVGVLAVVAKQRGGELGLALGGREDGEVGVAKGRGEETRLLLGQ